MERIGLTLSTRHEDLISGLKKTGLLGQAVQDIGHLDLLRHVGKQGYALRLRKDGKAYTLARWDAGKDLGRTLEQYLEGSGFHFTIK